MLPLILTQLRRFGLVCLSVALLGQPVAVEAASAAPCALQGRTVSLYVPTPTGWRATENGHQHDFPGGFDPSQSKNSPGYSSLQFVLPNHPGAAVLEVRVRPAEKTDAEGQAAIHQRYLAEERKDYPTATSRTVGRVALHGQTVWIQRMESDGYEFYNAVLPLGAETIVFSLLFEPDATSKDKAHGHNLHILLKSSTIQRHNAL